VNWLDLDFNKVLRAQERLPGRGIKMLRDQTGNGVSGNGHSGLLHISNDQNGHGHSGNGHVGHGNGLSDSELEALRLISGLTDDQRKVLVDLIKAGFSSKSK
jgi:hypothetical protein